MDSASLNARYRAYLENQYALTSLRGRYTPYLLMAAAAAFLIPASLSRHWVAMAGVYFVVFLISTRGMVLIQQDYRRRKWTAEDWKPVSAVLVQANPGLFRAGLLDLSCTVIFSFDNLPFETLSEIAGRVAALKEKEAESSEPEIAAMLTSPAVRSRRKQLPASLTNGAKIFIADLFVNRRYLELGYLTHRTLPSFAEPGEVGGLELMPWQIVAEEKAAAEPIISTVVAGKTPTAGILR